MAEHEHPPIPERAVRQLNARAEASELKFLRALPKGHCMGCAAMNTISVYLQRVGGILAELHPGHLPHDVTLLQMIHDAEAQARAERDAPPSHH
jgi:hypothetical protein